MANGNGRVKIKTFWGRNKLLEISVRPQIDKVAFYAGQLGQDGKVATHMTHYVDLVTAGRIARQIVSASEGFSFKFKEFKGGADNGQVTSRVLEMSVSKTKKLKFSMALFITLSQGPGKKTQTGAVLPAGEPTQKMTVAVPLGDAQDAFYALDAVITGLIQAGHGLPKDKNGNGNAGSASDAEDIEDAPAPEEEEDLVF